MMFKNIPAKIGLRCRLHVQVICVSLFCLSGLPIAHAMLIPNFGMTLSKNSSLVDLTHQQFFSHSDAETTQDSMTTTFVSEQISFTQRQSFVLSLSRVDQLESNPEDIIVTAEIPEGQSPFTTVQTIPITVSGSGIASAVDYAPIPDFNITVAANQRRGTATFKLTPENDTVDEADETLTISSSSNLVTNAPLTFTILDDDPTPRGISLGVTPNIINESKPLQEVTITLTVNSGSTYGEPQSIPFSVKGTLAPAAVDFEPVPDFTIVVPAGERSATGSFNLKPINDSVDEDNEVITVSSTSSLLTIKSATIALDDDDLAPRGINLTSGSSVVFENLGPEKVEVYLQVSAFPLTTYATDQVIPVTVTQTGTPSVPGFEPIENFNITLPAETSQSAPVTITITPIQNLIDEEGRTITINSSSSLLTGNHILNLIDDDETPTIGLTATPSTINEGDGITNITITGTLNTNIVYQGDRVIPLDIQGSGIASAVDFTSVSSTNLTIVGGASSGTASFSLTPIDDAEDEDNEEVSITSTSDLISNSVTIEIVDNDVSPGNISLEATPSTIEEDDGSTSVSVTATIGTPSAFSESTTFTIDVSGSGRSDVVEFSSVSSFTLVFDPGTRTSTETFVITPINDDEETGHELITLSSRDPLITGSASIQLLDDDADGFARIALSSNPSVITEDSEATPITITATLLGAVSLTNDLIIPLSVSGSGRPNAVDFAPVADFSVTIAAFESSVSTTFDLIPENDQRNEIDEEVTIESTDPSVISNATVIIEDDDLLEEVQFSVDPSVIHEDQGPQSITITATIDNGITSSEDLVFPMMVQSSGNENAVDFEPISEISLTIDSGENTGTTTLTVTPENDLEDEVDEILTIVIDHPLVNRNPTIRLVDDDKRGKVQLSITPSTVNERDGPTVITINGRINNQVAFPRPQKILLVIQGSEGANAVDFQPVSNVSLDFEAGDLEANTTFTLTPLNDSTFEIDEILMISNPDDFLDSPAIIRLINDDPEPQNILLEATPSTILEDRGPTTITVEAIIQGTSRFSTDLTLPLQILGDNRPGSVSFLPVTGVVLTIAADSLKGRTTFELVPENNNIHQPDATITITSENSLVMDTKITLENDDLPPNQIALSVEPVTLSESSVSPIVTVRATILGETTFSEDQVITMTAQGTGDETSVDFTAIPDFTVTLDAQASSGHTTLSLEIEDDQVDETNEIITFSSSHPLISQPATLTLVDNDDAPIGFVIDVQPSIIIEGDGAKEITVTATIVGETTFSEDQVITMTAQGTGDETSVDFTAIPDFTVTLDAQASSGHTTLSLEIEDDQVDETNEIITFSSSHPLISQPATLTLVDNDDAPIGFVIDVQPSIIIEGDGAKEITVTATIVGDSRYASPQSLGISISNPQSGSVGYETVDDFTIEVASGATSGTGSFFLVPRMNTIAEEDATITLNANHQGTIITATMIIRDDDESTQRIQDVNTRILPDVTRAMISSSVGALQTRLRSHSGNSSAMNRFSQDLSSVMMRFQRSTHTHPFFQEPRIASRLQGANLATSIRDRLTVWVYADYRSLTGNGDQYSVDYDGGLTGLHAGMDLSIDQFLVGVGVSQFFSDLDFTYHGGASQHALRTQIDGLYELNTLTINPYATWSWSSYSTIWAMISLGAGDVKVSDPEVPSEESNTSLNAYALGADLRLLRTPSGFSVTAKGAIWGGQSSLKENLQRIQNLDFDVSRFQLSVEGSYHIRLDQNGTLQPFVEAGMRGDGGDGDTGAGLEMGGGARLSLPAIGLRIQGHGHALVIHGSDINEWGIGGLVSFAPGGITGPSVEVRSLSGVRLGSFKEIWEDRTWFNQHRIRPNLTFIDSRIGYGFAIGSSTVTPYAGMNLGSGGISQVGAEYRMGSRFSMRVETLRSTSLTSFSQSPLIRASVLLR